MVQRLRVTVLHFLPNVLLGRTVSQECLNLRQPFEKTILEDDPRSRVHEPQQGLSPIMVLIILLIIPGGLLRDQDLLLYFNFIGSLQIVPLGALRLEGVRADPFDLPC